jgi:hypothetical protein
MRDASFVPRHNHHTMDSMDLHGLPALVFGLAVGGYAGPVARRMWDQGLSRDIRAAKDLALGAAVACLTIAVAAVAVAARLAAWLADGEPLRIVASTVLLALGSLLAAIALLRSPARGREGAFAPGHALLPAAYRITMGDPRPWLLTFAFALQLPPPHTWEEGLGYAVFIFAGSLLGLLAYAVLARLVGKPLSAASYRAVNIAAALVVIALAVAGLTAI